MLVFSAALTLGACQAHLPHGDASARDPLQVRREAVLAAADWSKVIPLTIEMHDYGYRTRELRLKAGQPYRLTLTNIGGTKHYFTAPEFLAAVATRKAEVPHQAEFKAPVFTSFEVFPRGGTLDLYFVPMIKGSYRAHCHLKDHERFNIEAKVVIE